MKKKYLAAAMAAAMTASMVPASVFASDAELPTITFMAPEYNTGKNLNNEGSDQVIEMYESYTGIHVDWKWANNDAYSEILGTTLLDFENMPMVLTIQDSKLAGDIIDLAREDMFWDLTPYLNDAERFPNLAQTNPEVSKALTVDGMVIGLYRARELGRNGISYRKDWAEAVGITEEPKTIDDIYDMFYKFAHNDPDGNGKDDTFAWEQTKYTGTFDIIQTWFGCGNGWVEQDGQLVPVHQTQEYMDALNWIKKCYDEGLIRSDFVSVPTEGYGDAVKKGEAGAYIDVMDGGRRIWDYLVDDENGVYSVVDSSVHPDMVLLGTVNDRTLATSGFNGYYVITKDGAKTEEDLINCLTYLDKINDPEMLNLADNGIEGLTYDVQEDGSYLKRNIELSNLPQVGLNQSITYVPGWAVGENKVAQTERDLALNTCYEEVTRPNAVTNPALGYLSISDVNAKSGTDLDAILQQARTQYICGAIDEAGLQDAWLDWADRGGNDLIAEINEMYQADQAAAE